MARPLFYRHGGFGLASAQQNKPAVKLLVVGTGDYSEAFMDYAIKAAWFLDCEIITVDFSEKSGGPGSSAPSSAAMLLARLSRAMGIRTRHIVKQGPKRSVVAEVIREIPGIRYILDSESVEYPDRGVRLGAVPRLQIAKAYSNRFRQLFSYPAGSSGR